MTRVEHLAMSRLFRALAPFASILASSALLFACSEPAPMPPAPDDEAAMRDLLGVPAHLEVPAIPSYNVPTREKIALGRRLFYDKRLSANQTQACASCHLQKLAFSDGKKTPQGSTGTVLFRNSAGLGDAAYHATLTWANDGLPTLEDQLPIPIQNDKPVELGVSDGVRDEVLARFDGDARYALLFQMAFPDSAGGATIDKIVFALASFCRTLLSGNSPYDRYITGDKSALNEQQRKGLGLFNGERFECFHCHRGTLQTASYQDIHSTDDVVSRPFFNNGLYNVDGKGSYPAYDQGLYDVTLNPNDRGKFRPPTLRNVALTAPYMHDGSIATLREVVQHYTAGGRLLTSGPNAGDGRTSPLKSGLVSGFAATDQEIDAVVEFLESLSDETFVTNPAFSDPFSQTTP
jgi:cytochrome c peroxidase